MEFDNLTASDRLLSEPPLENGAGRRSGGELERLVSVANVLLRYRWSILVIPVVAFVVAFALGLRHPKQYTADAKVISESGGGLSLAAAGGLGAQLGLGGGNSAGAGSPDYYNEVISSRTFQKQLLDSIGSLTGVGKIEMVSTKAGMMRLKATAASARLAKKVAEKTLAALAAFDRERRLERIAASREFTEERATEARQQVEAAEDRMKEFIRENRGYQASPVLMVQFTQLQRDIEFRQQIFVSLAQSTEQARIDELRDSPMLSVLDPPILPPAADPSDAGKLGGIAAVLGLLVAIGLAFLRDFLRRHAQPAAATSGYFAEFAALRREAVMDIRSPLRPVRRLFRTGPSRAAAAPLSKTQ